MLKPLPTIGGPNNPMSIPSTGEPEQVATADTTTITADDTEHTVDEEP